MKNIIADFKKFALKGNIIDLAIGLIIGSAFGKMVSSLVNDVLMPFFGMLLGGINFTNLKYVIAGATKDKPEVAIYYGSFLQAVVDFFIISISVFIFLKFISFLRNEKEEIKEKEVASKSPEIALLEDIRDLLKNRQD